MPRRPPVANEGERQEGQSRAARGGTGTPDEGERAAEQPDIREVNFGKAAAPARSSLRARSLGLPLNQGTGQPSWLPKPSNGQNTSSSEL